GFTSMASVTFAHRIGQLVPSGRSQISLFRARDFSMRQLKSDNVILVGSARANPWEELIQDRLNFRYGFDQVARYSYFANLHPRSGEAPLYRTDSGMSYCRIAFLPNLTGTGNILAIAGTEIEGTEAGGEFVSRERAVRQLQSHVRPDATGRLPY